MSNAIALDCRQVSGDRTFNCDSYPRIALLSGHVSISEHGPLEGYPSSDHSMLLGGEPGGGIQIMFHELISPASPHARFSFSGATRGEEMIILDGFEDLPPELSVVLIGNGEGTVVSNPAGIDCPDDCSEVFEADPLVNLEAQPDAFSSFNGWSGDCSGEGPCMLLMETPMQVTASFSRCSGDALTGDADEDGWCADLDCNDGDPLINPDATELCNEGGVPNGVDENCSGYLDESCDAGCDLLDLDADGFSECEGDCDDWDHENYPGNSEQCDGKDNDCNLLTTGICEAGDPCLSPLDDQNETCVAGTLCTEVLNEGRGTGGFACSALCSSTQSLGSGDQCEFNELNAACSFDLQHSANVHACAFWQSTLGAAVSGAVCTSDDECRSGKCAINCLDPGCETKTCQDNCVTDLDCLDPDSVCAIGIYGGACVADNLPPLGVSTTGMACSANSECDHGICFDDNGSQYCSQGCKGDNSCPEGYACSLMGVQTYSGFTVPPPFSESCSVDEDCESGSCLGGSCAWDLVDTAPICVENTWQGTAGTAEACASNSDCISNYCERNTQTCLNTCTTEADCPNGTACTLQFVETVPGGTSGTSFATYARVCVSTPTVTIIQPLP